MGASLVFARGRFTALAAALLSLAAFAPRAQAAPTGATIVGEIQGFTIDNPTDVYSGGTIVVGGKAVILPRNLLLDLPANRLTLQQLYAQAPANCLAVAQTGLAKTDVSSCNPRGAAGIATITANRMDNGNVIAGDVFIQKGLELVTGAITYIDYAQGYFRIDGTPNSTTDDLTGTMVRINDPTSRHTIQVGLGCAGGPNCSPDPRFTLDPDNYVNVFATGYPWCIPSTVSRTFADVLGLGATTAQAATNGAGDVLCPQSNRPPFQQSPDPILTPATGPVAADSRLFAPLKVGDRITAEGNLETIAGTTFLSAHTTQIALALRTRNVADQPDYIFLDEVELDAPGFENQRARSLIIGYSTLPSDVVLWTLHRDPLNNEIHEFPWASSAGCEIAAGPGSCALQGAFGNPNRDLIWKVRHDVDFILQGAAQLDESPCAHIRNDPRLASLNVCPGAAFDGRGPFEEEFAILSPMPREVQARTGHGLANPGLVTLDVNGAQATNGQYLFPFGVGLGGIAFPEFNEIDLNQMQKPFNFSGIPWMMDRRLSPGGCINGCESTPQPLDPFPYDGQDPRTQSNPPPPTGAWFDVNYTATPLSNVSNRILSFVDGALRNFNGDATVMAWPPTLPGAFPILPMPEIGLVCTATTGNLAPVATDDVTSTTQGTSITVPVLTNDSDPNGDTLVVTGATSGQGGSVTFTAASVTYTPTAAFSGTDAFAYTIADGRGGIASASVFVTVLASVNAAPVANPDSTTTNVGVPVAIAVLTNDTDANGDTLAVVSVTQGLNGTVTTDGVLVQYVPNAGFIGPDNFTYTISDPAGATASALVTITVIDPVVNQPPLAVPDTATTDQGLAVAIPVLANDIDPDQNPLSVITVSLPVNGSASTDGSIVFYSPNPAFVGTDSFSYTISDGRGGESFASVTVTVNGNQFPVANADTATTPEGSAISIPVLANDTDPNGDLLSVIAVTQPPNGTVTRTATQVTYTPKLGFKGATDTFSYTVGDGRGGSATASVTVTVQEIGGLAVTLSEYRVNGAEWRVNGTSTVPFATITIRVGSTLIGTPLLGTTTADAVGVWAFRLRNSALAPGTPPAVSIRSSTGATLFPVAVTVR